MKKQLSLLALAGMIASTPVLADMDVGAVAGTNGAGVRLGFKVNDAVDLRLEGTKWSLTDTRTIDGIRYDTDVDLGAVGVYADWHPFDSSSFRLSTGFVKALHEVRVKNVSIGSVNIGDNPYTVNPGDIFGKASFNTAPYIGIGWSRAGEKGWGFAVDIGAWYLGKPDVSLNVSNNVTGANINQDINKEAQKARDDIGDVWYPNLSITLKYGF